MAAKNFRLRADQIRPVAEGRGGCMASDRITVDGRPVGYMYREEPRVPEDCGWRFLAGDESREYMHDSGHHEIYDVNTIANYDPQIIPLLDSPIGSAFAREGPQGELIPVDGPPPEEPVRLQMTKAWSLLLAPAFQRRIEDGCLVLWASGRTIWISSFEPKEGESPAQRLAGIKQQANPNPVERYEPPHRTCLRFGFLLMESDDENGARWALYAATVAPTGAHLWMAFYVDAKEDLAWARSTWDSVEFTPPAGK